MKEIFFIVALLLLNASACGSIKTKETDAPLLIHFEDGATITICGAHGELLKESVTKWGAAIGRSYNIVLTCDVKSPTIRSFASSDPASISLCKSMNATDRMFTEYSTSLTVYDCNKSPDRLPFSVLHETGHLFGLCDQYFKSTLPNCDEQIPMSSGSVMAVAGTLKLTPDDITGIRALQALQSPKDAGSVFTLKNGYYVTGDESKKFFIKADIVGSRMQTAMLFWVDGESEFKCSKLDVCASHSAGVLTITGDNTFTYKDKSGNSFSLEKNEESTRLLQNGYYVTADKGKIFYIETEEIEGRTQSVKLFWPGGGELEFTCSIMKICASNSGEQLTITGDKSLVYVDKLGETISLQRQ